MSLALPFRFLCDSLDTVGGIAASPIFRGSRTSRIRADVIMDDPVPNRSTETPGKIMRHLEKSVSNFSSDETW